MHLLLWADQQGSWKGFEHSAGFRLPGGAPESAGRWPPLGCRPQPFTAPTRRVKPTPRTVWISWDRPGRSILRRR